MDKRYIYDRKEAKEYGDLSADKMLVGAGYFKPGQRLLVVDDSITTGLTKVETIEKLQMLGDHHVVGIVVAVDRQERLGDKDNIEDMTAVEHLSKHLGVQVFSIENISSIYRLLKDTLDAETHRFWLDYFARYGAVEIE
jgi:orotate phosphoribosyltransferase